MTHIYTSVEPIYSLFDLKIELSDYLLNEYQHIIENDANIESDLECECATNPDVQNETWEITMNEALIRLGNYIATNNVKI